MRRLLLQGLAFCILLSGCVLGCAKPSVAAGLSITDYETLNRPHTFEFTPVCNAWLSGNIAEGDAPRIEAALLAFARSELRPTGDKNSTLEHLRRDYKSGFYAVCLSGVGGDIREALKIAKHLRGWMTVVPANAVCESACAVIFMKGKRRNGVTGIDHTKPGRFLHITAKLGFHSPMLSYPGDSKVSPNEVSEAYTRALRTMTELSEDDTRSEDDNDTSAPDPGKTPSGLDFVGRSIPESFMPRDLILAILLTPPDEMFHVTRVAQALYWGIDLFGVPEPRFISREMLHSACFNLINMRCQVGGSFGMCLKGRPGLFRGELAPSIAKSDDLSFLEMITGFDDAQGRTWPPADGERSRLIVHGYRYGPEEWYPERNMSACHARIAFLDGKLRQLEIDTFNNARSKLLTASKFDQLVSDPLGIQDFYKIEAMISGDYPIPFQEHGVRTWMMFPKSYKLEDLIANKQPWSQLEKTGAFLDQNAIAPVAWLRGRKIETRECISWDGCAK